MPKVSVSVPIYNVEKYIEKCVRSLFEQTLDDIEYIFVNDCTPDKSMDILRRVLVEYPQRQEQVKVIDHKVNKGSATVRIHVCPRRPVNTSDGATVTTGSNRICMKPCTTRPKRKMQISYVAIM